jgi:hypothetical protein
MSMWHVALFVSDGKHIYNIILSEVIIVTMISEVTVVRMCTGSWIMASSLSHHTTLSIFTLVLPIIGH